MKDKSLVGQWINLSEYYLSKKKYGLARTSYINAIDEYNKSNKEIENCGAKGLYRNGR